MNSTTNKKLKDIENMWINNSFKITNEEIKKIVIG